MEILFIFFPLGSKSLSYIYIDTLVSKNCLIYIIIALNILTSYYYFSIVLSAVNSVMGFLKFF